MTPIIKVHCHFASTSVGLNAICLTNKDIIGWQEFQLGMGVTSAILL